MARRARFRALVPAVLPAALFLAAAASLLPSAVAELTAQPTTQPTTQTTAQPAAPTPAGDSGDAGAGDSPVDFRTLRPGGPLDQTLAWISGLALAALLAVIQRWPPRTREQKVAMGVGLSLSAGGVAAVIPGFFQLSGKVSEALTLRAGGAIAVFAVVLWVYVRSQRQGGEAGAPIPGRPAAPAAADPLGEGTSDPDLGPISEHWIEQLKDSQHETDGGFRNFLFDRRARVQAWSTAQCVVALTQMPERVRLLPKLEAACEYLEAAGLDDGWGYFEGDEVTVTEVGCWATLAHLSVLEQPELTRGAPELAARLERRVGRDLEAIVQRQHDNGGWSPVAQVGRRNLRTYTSVMALWTLLKARALGVPAEPQRHDPRLASTVRWLLNVFDRRLGWVPSPHRKPQREDFLGLTAQVLAILRYAETVGRERGILQILRREPSYAEAKRWLLDHEDFPHRKFSKNDNLADADQVLVGTPFRLEGSTFLWCPWSALALGLLAGDSGLVPEAREKASRLQRHCLSLLARHHHEVGYAGTYETAETLLCTAAVVFGRAPAAGIS